jgi:tight adherence protein B
MFDHLWNPQSLAVALAVFLAVVLLAAGIFLLWRRHFGSQVRQLERRLAMLEDERAPNRAHLLRRGAAEGAGLGRSGRLAGARSRLQLLLQQADLRWAPQALLAASVLGGLLAFFGAQALTRPAAGFGLASAALGAALPWLVVWHRRRARLAQLQRQLPDALDLMARALQAGHAFGSALQMVSQEMAEPIGGEFRIVHDELNFGMGVHQAFAGLTERAPLNDLRYFVVAVLIQRDSGGNLAELLASLAQLIRERLKFLTRVRVLSSEGRLSSWILVGLPFALGGLLNYFNPEFMRPLWTDPLGISILNWMLGLMALGVVLIQKIVRLRV